MLVISVAAAIVSTCLAFPHHELDVSRGFECNSGPDDVTKCQEVVSSDSDSDFAVRSFLLDPKRRWDRGIVPYVMDPAFTKNQVKMIVRAMKKISNVSCVRWVKRYKQQDYVVIQHVTTPNLCSANVGHFSGKQWLRLGDKCFDVNGGYQGAIEHEMLHNLGFIHEQQRMDRDCYVKVANKVIVTAPSDFAITKDTSTDFPYDYNSIMHYGASENMQSKVGARMGNTQGEMTEMDVMKLNNMYCRGPTFCQIKPEECRRLRHVQQMCVK